MKILYRSHVENLDWTEWKNDGEVSGTVSKGLRLEAIQIKLEELNGLDIRMEYQAHCENYGWMPLKTDGEIAGTVGEGLRLEALRIRLIGPDSDKYKLKYRLHIENIGWQLWKNSGDTAGTTGTALRAEAIELRLVLADSVVTVPDDVIVDPDPETGEPKVDPITGIPIGRELTIGYATHTENIGWSKEVAGGLLSGKVGQGLRMEAIRMMVLNKGILNLGVEYQAHVENIGWQAVAVNNATAGTTDQGLRLEALRIRLTGANANDYSVWYRVHVENQGWQDWRRDWEVAGTTGEALRAEAIYILIAEKNKNLSRIPTLEPTMSANYRTHIQNQNWTPWVKNGRKSGTSGQALRMEAFEMNLSALDGIDLGVRYKSHVQNVGWQGWKTENQTSGTVGQSKRLEAIQIELTGTDASKYTVQYRVHIENIGWSEWAVNGGTAGTIGQSLRMEAISVVITKNGLSGNEITNEIKNKVPNYQVFATEFPNKEYLLHDLRTEHKLIDLVKTEGENKIDGLTFTIDPTHEHYNDIKELKTTILVFAEYSNARVEKIFEGRVIQKAMDYNNLKKITCEGEKGYLRDGIQRPGKYENMNNEQWLTIVLDGYNQGVTADRRFYMGIVTLENGKLDALRENDYINTYDLIHGTLINQLGGYLQIEQVGGFRFINYLENYGQVSTQAVEFGKNLLDLNQSSQSIDVVTALVPVGKAIDDEKLNIATVNENCDYIYNETLVNKYGWIFGYKEWSEIDDAETLKQKGYEYLEMIANTGLTLELTALDLSLVNVDIDKIQVGDALRCVSKPHGIDLFLVVNHKEMHLTDPSQDRIVMGDEVATITGLGSFGGGGGGFKSYVLKSEAEVAVENTIKDEEETQKEIAEKVTEKQIIATIRDSDEYQMDYDGKVGNDVFYEIVDRVVVVEQEVTEDAIVNKVRANTLYKGDFATKADNSTVTVLASRINVAEQKITADAIVSTVTESTTYTADLAGKTNVDDFLPVVDRVFEAEQKITARAIVNTVRASGDYIMDLSTKADGTLVSAVIDRVAEAESKITPFAITQTVTDSTTYKSDLNGKVGTGDFNNLFNRVSSAEQKITADAITNTVRGSQDYISDLNGKAATGVVNALTSRVSTAESKITDSAIVSTVTSSYTYTNALTGKVSTNQVISSINQSAESIKINASKVNITGLVTFDNLSTAGQTTINGGNISGGVLDFAYITARNRLTITTGSSTAGVQVMAASGKVGLMYSNDQRGLNLDSTNGIYISTRDNSPIVMDSPVQCSFGLTANNLIYTATSGTEKISDIKWVESYVQVGTTSGAKGITVWDSDRKLKRNITDSKIEALKALDSIKVRSFDWIKDGQHDDCGFVAQEIEDALGEKHVLKIRQKSGELTYQIAEKGFIPLLTKGIQELNAKFKDNAARQQNEIAILKLKIQDLKGEISC